VIPPGERHARPRTAGFRFRLAVLLAVLPVPVAAMTAAEAAGAAPARPGVAAWTTTPPDPVFPLVGNSGYDVRHYRLTLNYDDFTNTFLSGTRAVITARNTLGTRLSRFSLDFAGPPVSSVRVNGRRAGFRRVNGPGYRHKLVVDPPRAVRRGGMFTVNVAYSGKPVEIVDPDGSREGWLRVATPGYEGAFVVNEPIGAMGWFPNNNTPRDKATFEFHNTVPTDRVAIANGELESRTDNGNGTWTWNWKMARPMATWLSTSSVGNYEYATETGALTGLPFYDAISNNNTPVEKAAVAATLNRQDAIISRLAAKFGTAYPFDSAGAVVDQLNGVGYALEVQGRIHFPTRDIDGATLAHELTHQWFGGSVTGPTWHDLWLQEGWATWGELWWDSTWNGGPATPAQTFAEEYTRGPGHCPGMNKWCTPPSGVTGSSLFDEFPTYIRPMMMIEAQRQIMGDAAFGRLVRRWQSRYRYSVAGRVRWISMTVNVDGGHRRARWDRFFRQWLDGTRMPAINPGNFGDG